MYCTEKMIYFKPVVIKTLYHQYVIVPTWDLTSKVEKLSV